jgi:2-polyprenyl-3-methyl-5-hydroxy-6-metoxy-1,4-benzoquinol methylase
MMTSEKSVNSEEKMDLKTIEKIFREHSKGNDEVTLNVWLTYSTLCRYRDWVPRPEEGETTIIDVGCYQPSIGYYFELGWRQVYGIAKEEGEVVSASSYNSGTMKADILIMDVEREKIPIRSEFADVIIMMEIFEHFGLDPMHAMVEVNRVLKPGGKLVFSTPNAASWKNLRRLIRGSCPFADLGFSGFSTNRHNRLYDCYELKGVFASAGFEVTHCTSRSYSAVKQDLRGRVFCGLVNILDRVRSLVSAPGRLPERQDYIFLVGRKTGLPKERYPKMLYLDESAWPSWYRTIRKVISNCD